MVMNDTKIYQNMKNKSFLSIEKNMIKWEKTPCYNLKKLFLFKKSTSILKRNVLKRCFDEKQIKAKYRDILWGNNFEKSIFKLNEMKIDEKIINLL